MSNYMHNVSPSITYAQTTITWKSASEYKLSYHSPFFIKKRWVWVLFYLLL